MSAITRKCSFCGVAINKGRGIMYVKSDGSILFFCSSKCRKNMLLLKRKPNKLKWVTRKNDIKQVNKL